VKLQIVSPDTLRNLRELIQEKYTLDVEIWSLRNVRMSDRWIVEEKMKKADTILSKIFATVDGWKTTQGSWTDAEWKRAKEIQNCIMSEAEGKRWWAGNPPWEDVSDEALPATKLEEDERHLVNLTKQQLKIDNEKLGKPNATLN
jgi:hypothetical protein